MSVPYLNGAMIDFVDTIEKQGFTIDNPNAHRLLRLRRLLPLSLTPRGLSSLTAQLGEWLSRPSANPGSPSRSGVLACRRHRHVPIVVPGSIATDHLMTFAGRVRATPSSSSSSTSSRSPSSSTTSRSAAAAWPPNMCFGLGRLGLRPVLVGAAGEDFADYRSWLERHGVDCAVGARSPRPGTPRGSCARPTRTMAQFASFYPGAMSEARLIELQPIVDRVGGPDLVLIGRRRPRGRCSATPTSAASAATRSSPTRASSSRSATAS